MTFQRCLFVLLALLAVCSATFAETFTVTLKAVDADQLPIAKADVALFWNVKDGVMTPASGKAVVTDAKGKAVLVVDDWKEKRPVLVLSADRQFGGIVGVSKADAGKEIPLTLRQTVRVKGKLECKELKSRPEVAITTVTAEGLRAFFTQEVSKNASFECILPAGNYVLGTRATDAEPIKQTVTVTADRSELDLGTIDLKANPIARLRGKTAPDLMITDARGVKADVKLAEFKGKWVYLEFWAYWCGPCCAGKLPELISLYESHAEDRDKFVVLAVHHKTAKSFTELDTKLPRIKKNFWQGKDLPFPVLLDTTGKTTEVYGIHELPTGLLIDPDGKLVGAASPADLEAKLPPLAPAKKWAQQRNMQKNVFWSFEPHLSTLNTLAEILKHCTNCEVVLDLEAVKASGLTPAGPLPGAVMGVNVTLRSLEELLLAPHGLGVEPSADGKKLLITKRRTDKEVESYFQKLHREELNAQLDPKPADAKLDAAKPLEIKDLALLEAVKTIGHEYDLPVALDAKAMHTKRLDPSAKTSGTIQPNDLRASLTKMLAPLGLVVEVRQEVVLVTTKGK